MAGGVGWSQGSWLQAAFAAHTGTCGSFRANLSLPRPALWGMRAGCVGDGKSSSACWGAQKEASLGAGWPAVPA